MITFKQLDTGTPKDIEVTTDDADELMQWQEVFEKAEAEGAAYVAALNLAAAKLNDDGLAVFVVPGDEASEIADYINELAEFLDGLNDQLVNG